MPKELIIIRGLPGSGKSTFATKTLFRYKRVAWAEADHYFTDEAGEYRFDPAHIKDAHAFCQQKVLDAMVVGLPVIVSNTFSQIWEMQPYFNMAERYGYTVQVYVMDSQYGNTHGVPEEAIERMRVRWEKHPKDISVECF
jgi:predicted kinase